MKLFTTISLVLVLALTSLCQDSKLYIGIELGPTISTFYGRSSLESSTSKLNPFLGANLEYGFNKYLSVKTGLFYERKGAKSSIMLTDVTGTNIGKEEYKLNYDYIIIPAMLSFSTNGKVQFYADAGLYAGYLIGQSNKVKHGISPDSVSVMPESYYETSTKFDAGLTLGMGIYIPVVDEIRIIIGLKQNIGFKPVSDEESVNMNLSSVLMIGLKQNL